MCLSFFCNIAHCKKLPQNYLSEEIEKKQFDIKLTWEKCNKKRIFIAPRPPTLPPLYRLQFLVDVSTVRFCLKQNKTKLNISLQADISYKYGHNRNPSHISNEHMKTASDISLHPSHRTFAGYHLLFLTRSIHRDSNLL